MTHLVLSSSWLPSQTPLIEARTGGQKLRLYRQHVCECCRSPVRGSRQIVVVTVRPALREHHGHTWQHCMININNITIIGFIVKSSLLRVDPQHISLEERLGLVTWQRECPDPPDEPCRIRPWWGYTAWRCLACTSWSPQCWGQQAPRRSWQSTRSTWSQSWEQNSWSPRWA